MTPGAVASRIMDCPEGWARTCHYPLESQRRHSPVVNPRAPQPILFFDGDCGLCHRFVSFLASRDRHGALHYAPLQGTTARTAIPPAIARSVATVVLLDEDGLHVRSTAAIRALAALGGAWRLAGLLRVVPGGVRDAVYGQVARRRYYWFGGAPLCPLPRRGGNRFLP
jgi:predicted DCC family thiol-disulfide oxidoreductase YuxK